MTAIPRLLRASSNPATRRLLEAGLRDVAPERSILALGAALGLEAIASAAPLSGALDAAGRAAAPGAPSVASAALPVASKALPSALSIGKWLLLGMCAGSVSSAGYWVSQEPPKSQVAAGSAQASGPGNFPARQVPRAESSPPTPATAPRAIATTEASASTRARSSSSSQGARTTELASPAAVPAQGVLATPADPRLDGALERETRLVDEARQALAARDSARAAALLENYDSTKVLGVLDREALLLRIELLLARGDPQGARALAQRFAQRYPTDAHLLRLRALLSPAAPGNAH